MTVGGDLAVICNRFCFLFGICRIFYKIRAYFGQQGESIPMSFVLGFYVSLVVKRWWEQYRLLPWPDTLALFISAAIPNSTGGINVGLTFYFLMIVK